MRVFLCPPVLDVLLLFFRPKPGAKCASEERGSDGSPLPVTYHLSGVLEVCYLFDPAPEPTLAGCMPCLRGPGISLKKVHQDFLVSNIISIFVLY